MWYTTWLATKVGLSWVEFVTETSVIFASLRDYKNSQKEQDSQLSVFSFSCAVNALIDAISEGVTNRTRRY